MGEGRLRQRQACVRAGGGPLPPALCCPCGCPLPLARSQRGGLQRATASIFTSGRSPPSVRSGEHARQGRVRAGFGPTPVAGGVRGERCEGSRHRFRERVHACGAVARFWGSAQGRAASLWPLGAARGSGRARQSSRAAHARAGTGGGATGLPRWGGDSRLVSPREGALGPAKGCPGAGLGAEELAESGGAERAGHTQAGDPRWPRAKPCSAFVWGGLTRGSSRPPLPAGRAVPAA